MSTKRMVLSVALAAAFFIGVSGYGGHSSAVSLSTTQQATPPSDREQAVNRSNRSALWSRQDRWLWFVSRCIREHESIHAGHYRAQNSVSSASGAYQMIDSLWVGASKWTKGVGVYAHARQAPAVEQDRVFLHIAKQPGGLHHWKGTGCPGTEG